MQIHSIKITQLLPPQGIGISISWPSCNKLTANLKVHFQALILFIVWKKNWVFLVKKSVTVVLSPQKKMIDHGKQASALRVWVVARGTFSEKEQDDKNDHIFMKEWFESSSRSFPAFWGLSYWKDKVLSVPCWCLLSLINCFLLVMWS